MCAGVKDLQREPLEEHKRTLAKPLREPHHRAH
jgi:hypothetical protein